MIYDLSKSHDLETVKYKLNKYADNNKIIEFSLKTKKRTNKQGTYVHGLFNLFGLEFGYTKEESKTHLKRECGDLMYYEKHRQKFLRSTADLNSEEMTIFIEFIRNHSAGNGLYLLSSEEYLKDQVRIDRDIVKAKKYL